MTVGSVYYHNAYFDTTETVHVHAPAQLEHVDLLVFWGGGDINPSIYGDKNIASDLPNHKRDSIEVELMQEAFKRKIPILGVCRGAQLACALLGGKLYQDVNNHNSSHDMVIREPYRKFISSPRIRTTSLHHQMMILPNSCEIIAESPGHSTRRIFFDKDDGIIKADGHYPDPEVAVNVDKKVLMVQGHPEYSPFTSQLTQFTCNLLNHFFGVKLS